MDRSDRERIAEYPPGRPIRAQLVGEEAIGLARWLAGRDPEAAGPSRARGGRDRADAGHAPASTPRLAPRLIYAPEVPREHPDRLAALRDGVAATCSTDVIRGVLRRGFGIAVAGGRPGRIAAAMIGWTLARAGLDPTILLRSGVPQLGGPARAGRGSHAVVDVDRAPEVAFGEPPGPAVAVLLDLDRAGIGSATLARAVACAGPSGHVLAGPGRTAPDFGGGRVASVSLERGSTWWGADLREERGRCRFRAFHRGRFAAEVRLRVPGRSSVLAALAALAACDRAAVPTREIKAALEDFAGVSGGFESRGSYRGVTLVDDDAADPRDVADALALARAVHGRRRLWAVLAPTGPPRSAMADALASADRVLLIGSPVDAGPWAGMLGEAGIDARWTADLDEALGDLDQRLEPGDVLLALGAGDVGTIADAFLRRLPRDRQGR